jgi:MrfA Zn-binding domain
VTSSLTSGGWLPSDFQTGFSVLDVMASHLRGSGRMSRVTPIGTANPGLAGLTLSCPECNARRSMDGIFSKQTWERFSKCSGKRPWLADADEDCDCKPRALQRGASNLYYPVTHSALSIPPWDDKLQDSLGSFWDSLVNVAEPAQRAGFISMLAQGDLGPILAELKLTPQGLADAIERRLQHYHEIDTTDLKPAEYRQFMENAGDAEDENLEFEVRREFVPAVLERWVSSIARAVRLREVRAMTGFTRINPPGDPDSPDVATISKTRLAWYPAIEVRGEGIFLALNEDRLSEWEELDEVRNRAEAIDNRYREDWQSRHGNDSSPPRTITPRFLLCHTLSHVLMRQLTLECGYSSAALQERIYAGSNPSPMAGLLIYTATSDADGTLGGLQRQGEADRIEQTLRNALAGVEWCSSDPLCISDMMGAEGSFSHSACHSCVLVPETSCEEFNYFLDRGLLVGIPDHPEVGFFSDLLKQR